MRWSEQKSTGQNVESAAAFDTTVLTQALETLDTLSNKVFETAVSNAQSQIGNSATISGTVSEMVEGAQMAITGSATNMEIGRALIETTGVARHCIDRAAINTVNN